MTVTHPRLTTTTQQLCKHLLVGTLHPLDEALLLELITTSSDCRDQALATLCNHHVAENPAWLTQGPNTTTDLSRALNALDRLTPGPQAAAHVAAMRAWIMWASHRPVQALRILRANEPAKFGSLLERTIAICPPPELITEDVAS